MLQKQKEKECKDLLPKKLISWCEKGKRRGTTARGETERRNWKRQRRKQSDNGKVREKKRQQTATNEGKGGT
jgi:hypothetical protein